MAVAVLAAGLSAFAHMAFWWSFLIIAGAIAVNGWVATLEDDLPGGFNNPDGANTPRYAVVTGWVVRALGALVGVLSVAMLGLHFFGQQ